MKKTPTAIPEVIIVEPDVIGDNRGYFMETWRKSEFAELGIDLEFVQENQSKSNHGILRGLHYQINNLQGKLIRVVQGEIFDAVVDMRKSSATFGQWVGVILSGENKLQLWVPPGFAHGFYVVSDTAEMVYKCTDYYCPGDEYCLLWNDSALSIDWPIGGTIPVLSGKDKLGLPLSEAKVYL